MVTITSLDDSRYDFEGAGYFSKKCKQFFHLHIARKTETEELELLKEDGKEQIPKEKPSLYDEIIVFHAYYEENTANLNYLIGMINALIRSPHKRNLSTIQTV